MLDRYNEIPFAADDMDHVLSIAGQPVWWVPSRLCSCFSYYNGEPQRALTADPDCNKHDEEGLQYLPAQWISGSILQKMQQKVTYHKEGMDVAGRAEWLIFPENLDGSENPAYRGISDRDLIIAIEATTTVTEPLPIGQEYLSRPIADVISLTLGSEPIDPALWTLTHGHLEWSPSARALSGMASITWQYHPIYTLLTAMPSMNIFAERSWPRTVYLNERALMGYQVLRALDGKVPGWL